MSTHPTLNCPAVAALKLFSSKWDKLNCLIEALPKANGSHTIVYWKDNISSKFLTVTSTQVGPSQVAVIFAIAKLTALLLTSGFSGSVISPPVLAQVTDTTLFLKVGINSWPLILMTSMEVGVPINSMLVLAFTAKASKQTWNKTELSGKVTPLIKVSSQPTLRIPSVLLLKLLATRSGIPYCPTVAFPKILGSHLIVYWKVNISSKPVALTSKQTWSPQDLLASSTVKPSGPIETGGLVGLPTVAQVMATDPSCKAGITAVLVLLITSIPIGVFENWIGKVPFAVADASKHTWYNTWSSTRLMPCKLLSSHPTRNCPAVVVLKFCVPKSDKPTWLIVAVPNCAASQFNECWKAIISVKPAVLTSTHTWLPQLPVALEIRILSGVLDTGFSLPTPFVLQVMATDPSCKAGITAVLVLLITSIPIGVFENWIGKVPFAVADASKHTWYNTWSSTRLMPCKLLSSHPTRNCPAVVVLKFCVPKSDKPTWLIVAVPNCAASQFNECWKAIISVKPAVLTSTHTWLPQVPVASEILIVKSVLVGGFVGVLGIAVLSHTTDILPSVKVGFRDIPLLSKISIGVGLLEKEIGEVLVTPEEAV